MIDLDDLDQRLLSLLRADARATTSALARALQVSRSTVQDRISRLERRQVIAGYTIRFAENYRQRQLRAHVMIQVNPKQSPAIVDALRNMHSVTSLQTVSGIYDLVTTVATATTEEMDSVLDAIGELAGVEKTTTSIVLTTKFQR